MRLKSLIEVAKKILASDMQILLEMPNLQDEKTGLSRHVYFSTKWVDGKESKHGPRIKISTVKGRFDANNTFSMDVSHDPKVISGDSSNMKQKEIDDIRDWIILNHDDLHKVWHGTMSLSDFKVKQQKLI